MLAIVWRWRAGLRLGTNLPVTHLEHPSMSSHTTPDDNACMRLLWETYLAWVWQNIYPMEFESPLPHINGQSIYLLQADQPWVDPCDTGMQRGSFLELQYRESLRTRWAGRWFRESRGQAQFQKVSLLHPIYGSAVNLWHFNEIVAISWEPSTTFPSVNRKLQSSDPPRMHWGRFTGLLKMVPPKNRAF